MPSARPTTPAAQSPARRPADPRGRTGRPAPATERRRRRLRWRRVPGRIVLAICFVAGAAAFVLALLPFSTVDAAGNDLKCGPAVFEVLMPEDPAFDDTPENAGCADPAQTRVIVAGGLLVGVLLVTAIAEWRTRRGSTQRDARWLASSPSGSRSPGRRARRPSGSQQAIGPSRGR